MKFLTKTISGVVLATCGFVGAAQAEQNDVEIILSHLMKEALYEVSSDIALGVKRSVLETTYSATSDVNPVSPRGKVRFRDITPLANAPIDDTNAFDSVEESLLSDD